MDSSDIGRPDELVHLAHRAMERAYAPYSRFRVGAALEARDGRIYTGCNVENASYPVTTCAERVAIGAAVVDGAREFRRVAICAAAAEPAPPCGMCRQALAEFGLDLEIVSVTPDGKHARWKLGDLLPDSFSLALPADDGGTGEGRGGAAR